MYDHAQHAKTSSEGRRILVVEDDDAIAELLEIILEMAGFQVRMARSASAVVQALDGFDPNAMVIDIKLPDGSGVDLLRTLRNERGVTAPAMMLTTTVDPSVVAAALAVGAAEYITKPFDDRMVIDRLQRMTSCQAA